MKEITLFDELEGDLKKIVEFYGGTVLNVPDGVTYENKPVHVAIGNPKRHKPFRKYLKRLARSLRREGYRLQYCPEFANLNFPTS